VSEVLSISWRCSSRLGGHIGDHFFIFLKDIDDGSRAKAGKYKSKPALLRCKRREILQRKIFATEMSLSLLPKIMLRFSRERWREEN
jgi:hypothetical protein